MEAMEATKPGANRPPSRALGIVIRGPEQTLIELVQMLKNWNGVFVVYSKISDMHIHLQEVPSGVRPSSSIKLEPPGVPTDQEDADQDTEEDKLERQGSWSGRGSRR
jgi:hypothetical protein